MYDLITSERVFDFYVFDIKSFDILIGHPIELFTHELPAIGAMNVKLGRDTLL